MLDPEAVSQIMNASRRAATLDTLTDRERQVLTLMAEGRSNTAIATALMLRPARARRAVEHWQRALDRYGALRAPEATDVRARLERFASRSAHSRQ